MSSIRPSAQLLIGTMEWAGARCREGACPLQGGTFGLNRQAVVQRCSLATRADASDTSFDVLTMNCPKNLV